MVVIIKVALHGLARGGDEFIHFDGGRLSCLRAVRGFEFNGAHCAFAHVGEPIKRCYAVCRDTAIRHKAVDQRIAKIIGQGIGQHGGQSLVGGFRQVGKIKRRALANGHL